MFYGWKLCFLCSLGNLMLQGCAMYGMNAFMEPLTEMYGWSRTGLSVSMGIAALVSFASVPLLGTVAMRFPLRHVMTAGALLGTLSLIMMGQTASLPLFTVFFTLLWISGQCCGGMVANALMCNWFVHHRGKAFGFANIGTSASGAIVPFLALVCVSLWGVAPAFAILGLATALLAPLCYWLIRDKPQTLGLLPDGAAAGTPLPAPSSRQDTSVRAMLHRPEVYYLGLGFGLGLMCASGIMSQLKPRFSELGLTSYHAMLLASLAAAFCAVSKFAWGWLCDKTSPLLVSRVLLFSNILVLAAALLPLGGIGLVLFSATLGTCCGGYWTVLPSVVSYYFGSDCFLAAYRFISFFVILKSVAYPILGLSYDTTGSYDAGYMVYIVLVSAGLGLLMLVNEKKACEYHPVTV